MHSSNQPIVVLDTNAVLDWLLFADGGMAQIAHAIVHSQAQWIATQSMRDEFERVLAYPAIAPRNPDAAAARTVWDRHAHLHDAPTACALVCSDTDDQKFIDLAIAAKANWLISKDKALLTLKKKALAHGVAICRPEHALIAPLIA
ncbi:MAG: putative toxin-antitoxin system toxin component, PIN family [Burkholderiaceae bacterium]